MNHTYRLVWNDTLGAFVVASENARARGKRNGLKLASAAVLSALAVTAHALPSGGGISAGTGSIAQTGATMTVNQNTQNLAVNWQSFNIGAAETVNFVQPNSSAIALNRVLGTDGTQILGNLNANGQVWVLNPNGVLFGRSAQVNVGGLVASTLGISDADFLVGKRTFANVTGGEGAVLNQGALTASDGGYVALLGGQVSNEGVIAARLGTVALAAGDKITLDFNGDQLLNVQVEQGALDALAENKQLIRADGGTVLMTAQAADALASAVVNNTGVIEARSIENHDGVIKLLGDMQNGTVNVDGTLDASAPTTGDGGFIETSAAHVLIADGTVVTTLAVNGLAGSWLIDPIDFTIASGSGALTTSGIGASTLSTSLGLGNVAIATDAGTAGNGDIFVNAAVSWSANKLTLTAHRNINISANLNASGTASLALEYGQGAVAAGNTGNYYVNNGAKVYLPAGANFSTKLGSNGATTPWTVITSLGAAGDATVAPGVMTLQGMNTGLAGNYVLGADIDASGTATWNANAGFTAVGNSVTKFTGNFDGLGHTVTGLTINRPANVASNNYQGLFGYTTGALSNVGLLNSNISGLSIVGALAGRSDGSISYSYADGGSVTGSVHMVGGLVGQGSGSISSSYTNVAVLGSSAHGASSSNIGGLIGGALAGSSISNSYSTGSVSGGTYVGGLVGQNRANIATSYASGTVTATTSRGGLIGDQLAGTMTNSYWDSATTGVATSNRSGNIAGVTDVAAAPYAQASYTGFDFAGSWRIYEGNTRPLLKSFLTPLIVTASDASKTYDGLAYSGGNGVTYSTAPDANLLGTASYGGTSQGAINAGSYTLTAGGLYSNQRGYDISYVDGALTVNKAALTVTANAAAKTYDRLAYSGGNGVSYSGFVNSETSAVLGGALVYGGTSQGAVNAGGYVITASGLTSGNYTIGYADGALTVNQASLVISGITASNKVYDGTTAATVNSAGAVLTGLVGGDAVTVSATGTFANKNVANGKTVTLASSYGGADVGNYAITDQASATANITAKALSVSGLAASNKVYDGTTAATVNSAGAVLTGLVGGDAVTVSATGTFADKHVANGKTVTLASSYGGADAGNYAITDQATATANITPASLVISGISAANKLYDGTTSATVNTAGAVLTGLVGGDAVTVSATGTFADKNVANGKTVALASSYGGADAGNYAITDQASATANITQASLVISGITASSKVYDGTTAATVNAAGAVLTGLVGGDAVTVSATGTFADKNVANGKTVTLASSYGGADAGNYAVTDQASATANITPASLTITANAHAKLNDGVPYAGGNGVSYGGFVNGETAAVLGGALAYGGSAQGAIDAGSYLITPGGVTSGNYVIAFVDGTLTIGSRVPSIPGAPIDGYTGAVTSASSAPGSDGNGGGGQGESNGMSQENAAVGSSSAQYVFVMHECGLRLPAGLDCK